MTTPLGMTNRKLVPDLMVVFRRVTQVAYLTFVVPTGGYTDFLPRGAIQGRVCGFL